MSPSAATQDAPQQDDDAYSPGRRSLTRSPVPSVYSYSSSQDGGVMLRNVHGRTLNSTNDFYMLPADATEHGRLDIQHEMLKKRMNGIFLKPDAVRRAMAPRQTEIPAALDIGTGSGSWVIDMAKLFPHADIVGLDLVPANLSTPPPGNCRFECDDVNLGLAHYRNSFDVVNFRCVSTGITRYRDFIDEVAMVLRPGGVFLVVDGDMDMYDEKMELIEANNEGEEGFTWTQKLLRAAKGAMITRNPVCYQFRELPGWLKQMEDWEETGSKYYYIPVGPWEADMSEKDKYIAELMRQDFYRLIGAYRPLLISHGYFPSTVDMWIEKTKEELTALEKKMYVKWHCTWAVKKRPKY